MSDILSQPIERLVLLDETGTNTAMTTRYARAPRGQRAHTRAPRNYGPNVTLIATMHLAGMGPAMVIDGALTREAFDAYVAQALVPTLTPGQLVVLDNLAVHTSQRARMLIEAAGCEVRFLPAYSPDFTPIEGSLSTLKAHLRRVAARDREALVRAIGDGITAISPHDIRGWFHGCGYVPLRQSL